MTNSKEDFPQSHKKAEQDAREIIDWPQHFVCGHTIDEEDFATAYFRVEGPNGPVSYVNPGREIPITMTMYELTMEAQSDDFEWVPEEETPFPVEEQDGERPEFTGQETHRP